jgi:rhamnosyltransferase
LEGVINAVSRQINAIVVVNNTPYASAADVPTYGSNNEMVVIALSKNEGIASAHNIGIKWAEERGFTHVLLLDQDSVPDPDMVSHLVKAYYEIEHRGEKVAAVAPRFFDELSKRNFSFIKLRGWRIQKISCADQSEEYVPIEYAISSGALIELDALRDIGYMDEGLFIDYVDIEWGFRATSKGYRLYGVCAARMKHHLGDRAYRLPFLFGKDWAAPVRSPLRHYYHFRNAILLYRRPYVPFAWVVNDAWRLILKFCFYSLMTVPRRKHFRMMCLGIWHGLRGRTGPLLTGGEVN